MFLATFGCAHSPDAASSDAPEARSLSPGIHAVDSGDSLSTSELFDRLADHRAVVVGESHGTQWHHEMQADLLRALHDRVERVGLGMEMFQRPFQEALDAYVAGRIDEETMLERTEYAERWGMDTTYYRPLWRYARDHELPLLALNARAELTKKVAKVGLDGLSDDERARLPDMLDTSHQRHRAFVRRAFGAHGSAMSDERFEHFYQAQVVWDETMAHRAATFLNEQSDVASLVVVTGMFHAHRDFAIPPRLAKRLERGDVASLVPIDTTGKGPWSDATLRDLREQNVADFVWVK